jgi:hypothetical protein
MKVFLKHIILIPLILLIGSASIHLHGQHVTYDQWYGCINSHYTFSLDIIEKDGKYFSGKIYHDQLQQSFEVSGQQDARQMIIHELDEHMRVLGRFEFDLEDREGSGIWKDPNESFILTSTLSQNKDAICRELNIAKFKINKPELGSGILWLADLADGTRIGRFWNEKTLSSHKLYSISSATETFTFCDSTDWNAYVPEEDPLALELEIISTVDLSLSNCEVLMDGSVFDFDPMFVDSCKKFFTKHANELLKATDSTDMQSSNRWYQRYYLHTDIDLWNPYFISGSVEMIGPKGGIDGFCFVFDRSESIFRDITYFLKPKYHNHTFLKDLKFEALGIAVDPKGLMIKGSFDSLNPRITKHMSWKKIKKQVKSKLLYKLLET